MIALFVMTIVALVFAAVVISALGSVIVGLLVLPFLLVAQFSSEGCGIMRSAGRGFGAVIVAGAVLIGTIGLFDAMSMEASAIQATSTANQYWPTAFSQYEHKDDDGDRNIRLSVSFGENGSSIVVAQADVSKEDSADFVVVDSESGGEFTRQDAADADNLIAETEAELGAAKKPDWVRRGSYADGDSLMIVVKGSFADSEPAAETSMLEAAAEVIKAEIRSEDPKAAQGQWDIPLDIIDRHAILERHFEIERTEVSQQTMDMHRVTAQVSLTPEFRSELQQIWKPQIVGNRILLLGIGIGLVTLLIVTFAGYYHVDNRTGGRIRGRLRLALMLILVGIGVGLSSHAETIEPILKKLTATESDTPPVSATLKR